MSITDRICPTCCDRCPSCRPCRAAKKPAAGLGFVAPPTDFEEIRNLGLVVFSPVSSLPFAGHHPTPWGSSFLQEICWSWNVPTNPAVEDFGALHFLNPCLAFQNPLVSTDPKYWMRYPTWVSNTVGGLFQQQNFVIRLFILQPKIRVMKKSHCD